MTHGAMMHVERYGTGERVFFGLHGWGGDHTTFAPLAADLPADVTLYAADLPGYGRSPAPRDWSIEAIADELVDAVNATPAPRLTVIGNCSGAIVGLAAAEALSPRVERFVLIDAFAFVPWYFKIFAAGAFGKAAYYSTFANPFGRWLTNRSLARRRTAQSDLTRSFGEVNHATALRHLALLAEIKSVTRFAGLRVPVDLAYGERTFRAVKQSVAIWLSLWPQARATELRGAGHLPIEEATAQLADIIFNCEAGRRGDGVAVPGKDGESLARIGPARTSPRRHASPAIEQ
ncbi:MAG TPA: alpha/beta fold hydrolase [Blastocatellia bacterium]|nr:alpha/beta fold hydrolase [Blastocatellia bacterium]